MTKALETAIVEGSGKWTAFRIYKIYITRKSSDYYDRNRYWYSEKSGQK